MRQSSVTKIVRMLMALEGIRLAKDLAARLDKSESTLSRKLKGRQPWTLDDLDALAVVFNLSPADFFRDPDELKGSLFRSRWFAQSGQVTGVAMPEGQMELALGVERVLTGV